MKNLLLFILLTVSSVVYSQDVEFFKVFGNLLNGIGPDPGTEVTIYRNSEDNKSWEIMCKLDVVSFHDVELPCNRMHLISFVNGQKEKILYINNSKKGGTYFIDVDMNSKSNKYTVIYHDGTRYTHQSGTRQELSAFFITP